MSNNDAIIALALFLIGAVITWVETHGEKVCKPKEDFYKEIEKEIEFEEKWGERRRERKALELKLIADGVIPPKGISKKQEKKFWKNKKRARKAAEKAKFDKYGRTRTLLSNSTSEEEDEEDLDEQFFNSNNRPPITDESKMLYDSRAKLWGGSNLNSWEHSLINKMEEEEHKNKISNHDNYIDFDESKP